MATETLYKRQSSQSHHLV